MAGVVIHVKQLGLYAPSYRAMAGDRQAVGRTMGEALDALTMDWDCAVIEAEVLIEPLPNEAVVHQAHNMEPHPDELDVSQDVSKTTAQDAASPSTAATENAERIALAERERFFF